MIGRPQAELAEEGPGHRVVVVLARIDELGIEAAAQSRLQGSRLDELWTRPDDADDAH